jgi:hypothetical protein
VIFRRPRRTDPDAAVAPTGAVRTGLVVTAAVGAGAVLVWALSPAWLPASWHFRWGSLLALVVASAAFAVGAVLCRRLPIRPAVVLILGGAVVFQLAAGFGPPRSSDDLYRYIWDGRVQAAGIDPYRYAPAAPELVPLRDDVLWPPTSSWCVGPGQSDQQTGAPLTPGCTLVNRPTVHTIYPPVAQALFVAVDRVSPARAGPGPIQLTAAVFAVATTVLLILGLWRMRLDPRLAVLWAWCPAVALEAASNAHVDVAAAFLTAAALLVLAGSRTRTRSAIGGVLLGLAVATKVTPILVGPSVLRRNGVSVGLASAAAVATVYVPHVVAVGGAVLGYLPGYLTEEGYGNGTRFALLSLVLPAPWTGPAAVAILAAVALWVIRRSDPDRPWPGAALMTGAAMLVTTPAYPWYGLLLVLLVAFGARVEWLAVVAGGYFVQSSPDVTRFVPDVSLTLTEAQQVGYGLALLVVVAGAIVRRVRDRPRPAAVPSAA